jgi:hypothetical protein
MGTVERCDGGVSRLLCYRIPALPWGRGGRELKAVAASCEPLWHLVPPWAGLRTGIGSVDSWYAVDAGLLGARPIWQRGGGRVSANVNFIRKPCPSGRHRRGDEGGLAGHVWSEQTDDLTSLNCEAHPA